MARLSRFMMRLLLSSGFLFSFATSLSAVAPGIQARPPTVHQVPENARIKEELSNTHLLDDLHTWANDHGIERKVEVQQEEMAGGGRGLIATERIEAGEVVVKVPLSAVLRLEAADPTSISGNYDDDDQWAGILAKKLWEESCHGDTSRWAPYIDNLPTEAPLTPCRWNSLQRQKLQNGNFVKLIQENSAWRIRQVKQQTIPNQHRVEYLKYLDLVCSRTLKGRDGSRQLVPLIDIANHAPAEAGGGHFCVDEDDVYLLAGSRGVNPGQAVTLDYGGRSVDDFLLHYGFVPHRCFSDSVIIPMSEIVFGVGDSNNYDNSDSHEFITVSWQDCQGYQGHFKEEVRESCSRALSDFPTTIEEDVVLLNHLSSSHDDSSRNGEERPQVSAAAATAQEAERWAINYRYAKKSLLTSAVGMENSFSPSRSAFATSSFQLDV